MGWGWWSRGRIRGPPGWSRRHIRWPPGWSRRRIWPPLGWSKGHFRRPEGWSKVVLWPPEGWSKVVLWPPPRWSRRCFRGPPWWSKEHIRGTEGWRKGRYPPVPAAKKRGSDGVNRWVGAPLLGVCRCGEVTSANQTKEGTGNDLSSLRAGFLDRGSVRRSWDVSLPWCIRGSVRGSWDVPLSRRIWTSLIFYSQTKSAIGG